MDADVYSRLFCEHETMRATLRLCLLGILFGGLVFPEISFAQSADMPESVPDMADVAVVSDADEDAEPQAGDIMALPESLDMAEDEPAEYGADGLLIEDASDATLILSSEMVPVDEADISDTDEQGMAEAVADEAALLDEGDEMRLPNPAYVIERIRITGNTQTSRDYILKMLALDTDKPVTLEGLEEARIRLVASGLFQKVDMSLMPGSGSGKLSIDLNVEERSRFQINRYHIGSSRKSPFWMGLDVDWLAPFGTNHRFRTAFAATSSNAYTLDFSYLVPMIRDLPVSLFFSAQSMRSSETLYGQRLSWMSHGGWGKLDRIAFERHGGAIGVGYAPIPHIRLMLRLEYMRLLRENDEALLSAQLDKYLKPGWSGLASARVMAAYDSREGRDLPNSGHFVSLALTGALDTGVSQYSFFKLSLAHQSNFEVSPQHVLRIDTFGGAVFGDAPFFEKFFYNDFYTLSPRRIHYLNPSNRGAYDLFGTGASSLSYEDFLVHLALSYAWQPFVRRLEMFVTVAATYADTPSHGQRVLGIASSAERGVFPVDMSFNLGVRFKTDYGLVSFSLVNVFDLLGR